MTARVILFSAYGSDTKPAATGGSLAVEDNENRCKLQITPNLPAAVIRGTSEHQPAVSTITPRCESRR
jgi:hypothetical protein